EFKNSFTTFVIIKCANGYKFLFVSDDYSIKCIDDENSTDLPLEPLTGHTGKILHLVYVEEVEKLISASEDNTIRVWDVPTWRCCEVLQAGDLETRGFDSLLITGGMIIASLVPAGLDAAERRVKIWDLKTYKLASAFTMTSFKGIENLIYKQGRIFIAFKSWFVFVRILNPDAFCKQYIGLPCYKIRFDGMSNGSCGLVFIGGKLYRSAIRSTQQGSEYGIEVVDFTAGNDEILKE